ncbi:hypothetical protein Poli38472_008414 [Pythium oligandrum]|uniref:Fanconi anemia group M protein n=1 Tax=Pythium oligandrum TaxID=41045 RepID=A0A8K1CNQ3_PYTOL|nr:hypothetical protein Poli38472_008414 [Pythium oligandrum]|eukprot:TMW65772.1 hypothetical protein Poli38472_008414 [Pythium oligandrum]
MDDEEWDDDVWSALDALETRHLQRSGDQQSRCDGLVDAPRNGGSNGALVASGGRAMTRAASASTRPPVPSVPRNPPGNGSSAAFPSTLSAPSRKPAPKHTQMRMQPAQPVFIDDEDVDDEPVDPMAAILAMRERRGGGEDPTAKTRYLDLVPRTSDLPAMDFEAAQTFVYPTNYSIREYQLTIAERSLYHNTLVSLPTGLGKTLIASVVMYNFYRWFPTGQIVFMAPTKPLVAQQIRACHEIMGISLVDTAELQGSVPPPVRKELWKTKRVFFCTPQSLQNDLQRGICHAERLVCLVIDEAHRATGNYAYCNVIQAVERKTQLFRVLALSATPGAKFDIIQDVIRNLRITHIESRSADDPDVRQYTHARQEEVIKCSLGSQISEIKKLFLRAMQRVVHRLFTLQVIQYNDPERLTKFYVIQTRDRLRQSPQYASKRGAEGDLALLVSLLHGRDLLTLHGLVGFNEYVEKLRKEVQEPEEGTRPTWAKKDLIGSTEFQALQLGLQHVAAASSTDGDTGSHPKLLKLREVLHEHFQRHATAQSSTRAIVFTQYRTSVTEIVNVLNALAPLLKVQPFVGQGTSKESKGQTQKQQQEIVRKFRQGAFNVLVATCIAEEGLDIGEVDLIVSFDALTSPVRMIQRMGRTGRKRVGKVIILVTEGDEEKKLARSVAAAKTVSRALTTFKNKFTYAKCPRMVPMGVTPQLSALAMEIPEFHASQIAGRQQKRVVTSEKEARKTKEATVDAWRLNELEKSIARAKYVLPRMPERRDFRPVVASRRVLLRRRPWDEDTKDRVDESARSRLLRSLVRRMHGVSYDDEDEDRAVRAMVDTEEDDDEPMPEREQEDEYQYEMAMAEMHFSPQYTNDVLASATPQSTEKVPSSIKTSTTKQTPPSTTTSRKKPRRSIAKTPATSTEETSVLERGERLLQRLTEMLNNSSIKGTPSPSEKAKETTPSDSETASSSGASSAATPRRPLAFPRITRRLVFDAETTTPPSSRSRENCVPPPPAVIDLSWCSSTESVDLTETEQKLEVTEPLVHEPTQDVPPEPPTWFPSVNKTEEERVEITVTLAREQTPEEPKAKPRRSLALRNLATTTPVTAVIPPVPSVPSKATPVPSTVSCPTEQVTGMPLETPKPAPVTTELVTSKRQAKQKASSTSTPSVTHVGTQREEEDDECCAICSEHESYEDDPIVFCGGCNVAVHQFCYGIPRLPTDDWFCDFCASQDGSSSARCALCPLRGGAFRRSSCGQWVHVQCYLWIPELKFKYTSGGLLSLGVLSRLDPERKTLECSLCHSTQGRGLVQCAHKRCLTAFHVSCARHGDASLVQMEQDDGQTLFLTYCRLHRGSKSVWKVPVTTEKPTTPQKQVRTEPVKPAAPSTMPSPSALLLSQPSSASASKQQRRRFKRLKRKYEAGSTPSKDPSQSSDGVSPWAKRMRRSQQFNEDARGRRQQQSALAKTMFIEDQAEAPSTDDEEDDDEEMDEADAAFINDSSQLFSPSRTSMSPGDMRAIYARSLVESPRTPALLRGQRGGYLPSNGIIQACLNELHGQTDSPLSVVSSGAATTPGGREGPPRTTNASPISIASTRDGEEEDAKVDGKEVPDGAPCFNLLGFAASTSTEALTSAKELPNKTAAEVALTRDSAKAEAEELQRRIEANRLRALEKLRARQQQQAQAVTSNPSSSRSPPLRASTMIASTDVPSFSLLGGQTPAPSPLKPPRRPSGTRVPVFVSTAFAKSHLNTMQNDEEELRVDEKASLSEADVVLSVRLAAVCMKFSELTTWLTNKRDVAQHPRVQLALQVFKQTLVLVVAEGTDSSVDARHPSFAQLHKLETCAGVEIVRSVSAMQGVLQRHARAEWTQGFGLEAPTDAGPKSALDENFRGRLRFFRDVCALSLGSALSLSFRFDRFVATQIPVHKFNEMHWRRMLPWISEATAMALTAHFHSS